MAKKDIQQEKIHRPGDAPRPSADSFIKELPETEGVVIQVTQAFCPKGHNLVRNHEALFDGEPGISLWVSDGQREGEVILSPFHGDHTRLGLDGFSEGAVLEISCPECRTSLPRLSKCSCRKGAELVGIFLTPALSKGQMAAVCNAWGCHRSKVFDQAQLLAAYMQE